MDGYSLALVVAAFITAVPATIAARAAMRAARQSKTSNGRTQAQLIEDIRAEQIKIALALLSTQRRAEEDAEEARAERRADRKMMYDHIKADLDWQGLVGPHILGRPNGT